MRSNMIGIISGQEAPGGTVAAAASLCTRREGEQCSRGEGVNVTLPVFCPRSEVKEQPCVCSRCAPL